MDSVGEIIAAPANVTIFDQVKVIADKAIQMYRRLDTWVGCTAVNLYATCKQTMPEVFKCVIDVNLLGQLHRAIAALPHLKQEGRGALIHISSVEARRAFSYHSAYMSSFNYIIS
jgi:NAD(P)-dependent dehydrogenase (short-subunit alcohol dehydrogenase family)